MRVHEKAALGFDRGVDSYENGRPEYPADAVEFLLQKLKIQAGSVLLDLGAGTGKFTRLCRHSGARILAVEPVFGMRKKFESLSPDIPILPGTAEEIPIESQSVDAVIVAQAFHWFDGLRALPEIHRVLKLNGQLGMIWNARDEAWPFHRALSEILKPYEEGTPRYRSMQWQKSFYETSFFTSLEKAEFSYQQIASLDQVIDRVQSISFISALPSLEREAVLRKVRDLVLSTQENLRSIVLPYRTDVFWCQKLT